MRPLLYSLAIAFSYAVALAAALFTVELEPAHRNVALIVSIVAVLAAFAIPFWDQRQQQNIMRELRRSQEKGDQNYQQIINLLEKLNEKFERVPQEDDQIPAVSSDFVQDLSDHIKYEQSQRIVPGLLEILASSIVSSPTDTRALLFLLNSTEAQERLELVYHSGTVPEAEARVLKFPSGQGVVGSVWDQIVNKNSPRPYWFEDLTEVTDEQLQETYHLSLEQIEQTRHLNTILGVPIFYGTEGSKKFIGVLSVDTVKSPAEAGLESEEVIEEIRAMAQTISELLPHDTRIFFQ